MGKQLEIESLEGLITAVNKYRELLMQHTKTLNNACNICDQAMGQDAISAKYIERLEEAIKKLDSTASLAANVAEALMDDLRRAQEIAESAGEE